MDTGMIKCPNCGAVCKATDEYCKKCWKRLGVEVQPADSIQKDMTQSEWVDWELFIGKNADRYIETYRQNQDKRIFPHMNWSAFCFGLNWVLYRRMTKVAIIGFAVSSLLVMFLFAIFLLPHRAEIQALQESADSLAALEIYEIVAAAELKTLILIPFDCLFWGLFGDSIYKRHIEKNINSKHSGTSVGDLVGGRIVFSVISSILAQPVASLILFLFF